MFLLILKILRDVILLPFNLVVVVPYYIYDRHETLWPSDVQAQWFGSIPFSIGVLGLLVAIVQVAANSNGSFAPWAKKDNLTVVGLYSLVRNPIYICLFLTLIGEALLFDSLWIFYYSLGFLVVCHFYLVFIEEEILEKRFRVVFHHYRKRVPRWIPQTEPYRQPKFRSGIMDKIKQGKSKSRSRKTSTE